MAVVHGGSTLAGVLCWWLLVLQFQRDAFGAHGVDAAGVAEDWYASSRCHEGSNTAACRHYERCKATHRCAAGDEDYVIKDAALTSFARQFSGGNRSEIALTNDMEDWKSGTHRWRFHQEHNSSSYSLPTSWLGWGSFDFPVIGSLELAEGYLVFDTDRAELRGDVQFSGMLATTRLEGTSVAVFNFMTVYLGEGVRVRFQGRRAVAILSRSSLIVDTELRLRPGTLGGFAGGGFVGSGASPPAANNNQNGPGSSSVRVFVKTLSTHGAHVPEIQEIETSAAPGQKLQGHFTLRYTGEEDVGILERRTQPIAYDASALDVRRRLETAFPDIGELHVERDDLLEQVPEIGRLWRITFLSAVGNVPQLEAESALSGLQSQVVTRTVRDGNQLSGVFQLRFLETTSRWLAHNVSAKTLRDSLLEDFPMLIGARVARTDPQSRCLQGSTLPEQSAVSSIVLPELEVDSGLYRPSEWLVPENELLENTDSTKSFDAKRCRAGRGAADGFVWKVQFWTREGNVNPTSPTSSVTAAVMDPAVLEVDGSRLLGLDATVEIVDSQCFSLAFGGAGASFTGFGGRGYDGDTAWSAPKHVDEEIFDLLGGSGGAGGGREPIDVFPVVQPTLGGAGAGAMLLSAVNDILIGSNAIISANGGDGSSAFTAGGGGSGGSLLLVSGATVANHGLLEATGGHGGQGFTSNGVGGGGGSGGRIAIYAQSYSAWGRGSLQVSGGASPEISRRGGHGSVRIKVHTELAMRVDASTGAAGTAKSLLVHGSERYASGSSHLTARARQVSRSGPRFVLDESSQPTRISYFVRVGNLEHGTLSTNRGAVFGIHSNDTDDNDQAEEELMLAIALVDGAFTHESNAFQWPRRVFQEKAQTDRWYKLDVTLDWYTHTYSIRLNDVLKVHEAAFRGEAVRAVSLNNFHAMSTWWDEIYVGEDHLLGFACPWVRRQESATAADAAGEHEGAVVTLKRSWRRLWAETFQLPTSTTFHPMVRHESHLSRQEVYRHDNGGIVPLDGAPHRAFFNDVHEWESEIPDGSSYEEVEAVALARDDGEEVVTQSELLTIEGLPLDSSIVTPLETSMDWTTHVGTTSESSATDTNENDVPRPSIYWYSEVFDTDTQRGGIGACSTVDYNEWRNEGLMLHFTNLTDPFGNRRTESGGLRADRPRVLFNRPTQRFVMWMHVDSAAPSTLNSMGLSGVASSEYPNGPFTFKHSLYPDAAPLESPGGQSINETHDQTVAVLFSPTETLDAAYLLRTYFKTVEYWLPRPVMDPLWQSVQTPNKSKDGSTSTDFGLSYHRAFHHPGYDDPTDIYLQRWRMEDAPWEVVCCSPTNVSYCVSVTEVPATPEAVCPDGMTKKAIFGQAQTQTTNPNTPSVVRTRYKDPNDDANSAFLARSVPTHTPWGFQVLNTKTWRGNYFDALSTNITLFLFKRFAGERRRREIEQDPVVGFTFPNEEERTQHVIPTNDTEILDEMLGALGVPVTVAFKSKYSTFDLAEIDQDGDGKVTAFEISRLVGKKDSKSLTSDLVDALLADFDEMKWDQLTLLDADGDDVITFGEFESWLGADPNLLFDQFDLDKNGFLDENELARSLWYRQMPRLDAAVILLDPSFDGRVYYERFRSLLLQAPEYIFESYDFDESETLTQNELDLMIKDLSVYFARSEVLEALKDADTDSISKATYAAWFSATTSLVGDARDKLKADNAVHATDPDRLTGPLHVVERRRAKYVAISALTDDYLSTRGLLREIEGDFEGREALVNFFAFSEDLFGLTDAGDGAVSGDEVKPFREFLSSAMLRDRASYWNGRHWEGRPSAPALFTYGQQCLDVAGMTSTLTSAEGDEQSGCLPCRTSSPYVSTFVAEYQSSARDTAHCEPQKELDAYIKAFDQQVAIQLQYQQQAQLGPQGLQPHMSPCFNQSQFFPCDVHKIVDGNVADTLRNPAARQTAHNLAWEQHANNVGSSTKIRADDAQLESTGPSFIERFPLRLREPTGAAAPLDSVETYLPDQLADVLGGGL